MDDDDDEKGPFVSFKDIRELLALVLFILLCWASCFGVTVRGKHYGTSCSCKDGVTVDWGKRVGDGHE